MALETACGAYRSDGYFYPCSPACDVLGCWYTRYEGPVGAAPSDTSVGTAPTDRPAPYDVAERTVRGG